jgi:hypothetical protein
MGFFKTHSDPISQRSRELAARIAELESRIQHLSRKAEPAEATDPRRFRSTAYPPGTPGVEPVFEPVDRKPLNDSAESPATARHYNDLGARKFDLVAVLERIKRHFRGPPAANPKLVTYLAAGNIHGLRPLRYEKRVARNRFIALTLLFIVVLFGIAYFLAPRR